MGQDIIAVVFKPIIQITKQRKSNIKFQLKSVQMNLAVYKVTKAFLMCAKSYYAICKDLYKSHVVVNIADIKFCSYKDNL